MNQSSLNNQIIPSLLVGAGRRALPLETVFGGLIPQDDPKAGLKALSLAGQNLRFTRPPLITGFPEEPVILQDRTILPQQLRRSFVRLLSDQSDIVAPYIGTAIASAMDRAKLAPHPFDLEAIKVFASTRADKLGSAVFAWQQRNKAPSDQESYVEDDTLDESNWTQASLGQKVHFIRQVRARDSGFGLQLLETHWTACSADERLRLLDCLRTGLSAADQTFLEALAKDRAPRVREAAALLLIRATQSIASAALQNALSRIKEDQAGLLKKRRVFRLEFPATVKDYAKPGWVYENFSGLSLELVAKALQIAPNDAIEAAGKDEYLLFGFFVAAINDHNFSFLESILNLLPSVWEILADTSFSELPDYTEQESLQWIEKIIRPQKWDQNTAWSACWKLLDIAGSHALPANLMEQVLRSSWAKTHLNAVPGDSSAIELLALLCPPALRPKLRALISTNPENQLQRVFLFLDIMDSLEALHHG